MRKIRYVAECYIYQLQLDYIYIAYL